ncbi:MAG: amidohydrolase family protein [Gammaproteobacteria bacterium]|nr:amidohydrolase family protein [Gammaproteobacteria bacterium]
MRQLHSPLRRLTGALVAGLLAATGGTATGNADPGPAYDLVIAGGRVIDPETGFDAVANVGIRGGRIVRVSPAPLAGRERIDATGLVVAPGFIDLHVHGWEPLAQDLRIQDGVTTALELEVGAFPVQAFYTRLEGKARGNFGASVGHLGLRVKLKTGWDQTCAGEGCVDGHELLRQSERWGGSALDATEIANALDLFRAGLAAGGLGLGLAHEYLPGTNRVEVYEFTKAAATAGVPVFVHVRQVHHAGPGGPFEMVQEMLADAAVTGAALHLCHVTSKGLNDTALILDAVTQAQAHGLDVTTEAYPYTAGSTAIGSALFNEGWPQRFGVSYGDVEWVATGERLTEASFRRYRAEQPAGAVLLHAIPESALAAALRHPAVMIASDGMEYVDGKAHPRSAGTYARVLGHFVRDEGALSLMQALRKMTIQPAQRLDHVPAMRRKGRLREGMDADLTIFDPATVIDRATYGEPARPSAGIRHVLVNGVPVVRDGVLQADRYPGQPIRR